MNIEDIRSDPPDTKVLQRVYDDLVSAVIHVLNAAVEAVEGDESQLAVGLAEVSDLIVDKLFILTVWLYENGVTPDLTRLRDEAQPLRDRLLKVQRG